MAQESSDALSARSVLPLAAPMIMVHVDELPVLKRLAACCLVDDLPLATLNVKDVTDFAEHEGLTLIGGQEL
jgi:hypothetical protein